MGDESKIPSDITAFDKLNFTPFYEARNTIQGALRRTDAAQLVTMAEDATAPEVESFTAQETLLQNIQSYLVSVGGMALADINVELQSKLVEVSQKLDSLRRDILVDIYNKPSPGNATDIVGGDLVMANYPGVTALAVTVTLGTGSVFNYIKRRDGATAFTISFNGAAALTAAAVYSFILPVSPSDMINFQVATTGVINQLYVEGLRHGIR